MEPTLQQQNEIVLAETLSAYVRLLLWPEENIGKWVGYGDPDNCRLCWINDDCATCVLLTFCSTNIFYSFRSAIENKSPIKDIIEIAHLRFNEILAHIANANKEEICDK